MILMHQELVRIVAEVEHFRAISLIFGKLVIIQQTQMILGIELR
jgi:hypothetical protein